jgi:hypothetical protein
MQPDRAAGQADQRRPHSIEIGEAGAVPIPTNASAINSPATWRGRPRRGQFTP